ncbi:uncharacterized protein [Fopius arisanus]|uniref:MULE transposase domain-containing protein n=1 Tax=Fopius arisanus TaxID=64838 RepID=A0A9R1SUF7_9HYME|nr:PREDICTED: uncharacterized protein LOC105263071 [Fopius arisanus]
MAPIMRKKNMKYSKILHVPTGHVFTYKSRWRTTIRYYQCIEKFCPMRGKLLNGEEFIITGGGAHNHAPNKHYLDVERFNDHLHERVTSSLNDFRIIWDDVAMEDPETAAIRTFVSAERSMHRWRMKNRPPIPRTLREFANTVNDNPQWHHLRNYHFSRFSIEALPVGDGSYVVVIADLEYVSTITPRTLTIDATFEVCPKIPTNRQFLTIMGNLNDTDLPIAWALMEKKNSRSCLRVLEYFKTVLAPHINPSTVHLDFERALRNTVEHVYPNARIVHCYFHYLQKIIYIRLRFALIDFFNSKALRKRLDRQKNRAEMAELKDWDQGQNFYRKLMALPLLPAEDMIPAFTIVKNNASPDITSFFNDLIGYIERWWLGVVRPENFTVYRLRTRVSNAIEAYHRVLLKRVGSHPSIWQFTESLRKLQVVSWTERTALAAGRPVRRPKATKYIKQEEILSRAWELYGEGVLDIAAFLGAANHFLRAFHNKVLIDNAEAVDYFTTIEEHIVGIPPTAAELQAQVADQPIGEISFATAPPVNNNLEILLLRRVDRCICDLCNNSIVEYVASPCRHWFACKNCTLLYVHTALEMNAFLKCRWCLQECRGFQRMLVRISYYSFAYYTTLCFIKTTMFQVT